MPSDGYVVETLGLKKVYGRGRTAYPALKGVSLKVKSGELLSIVGPSGSGKSTLLNLLGALDRPTEGKVYIDGIDIYRLDDDQLAILRNRKIGFVFQAYNLIPRLSALSNVQMPLLIRNLSDQERRKAARTALEMVGLGDKIHRKPTELSGGEQQRIAIARALVGRPSIVLADEPTGNIDSKTTKEILNLIKGLNERFGTTFIIVTHNLEVAHATQRIVKLRDGLIEGEQYPPFGDM